MSRRITEQDKEKIKELMGKGLNVSDIARELNLNHNTASMYVATFNKGLNSVGDYQNYLAKNRRYDSFIDYIEDWAKEKGFKSFYEYNKHSTKERQQKPKYKELAKLIKDRLKELGKNQNWLAAQLGITRQSVSYYIQAKSFPKEEIQKKLDRILLMNKEDLEGRV